jgi:hypothetical protein
MRITLRSIGAGDREGEEHSASSLSILPRVLEAQDDESVVYSLGVDLNGPEENASDRAA